MVNHYLSTDSPVTGQGMVFDPTLFIHSNITMYLYEYIALYEASGVAGICCKEGQIWKYYVMGHSRLTLGPDAAAAR